MKAVVVAAFILQHFIFSSAFIVSKINSNSPTNAVVAYKKNIMPVNNEYFKAVHSYFNSLNMLSEEGKKGETTLYDDEIKEPIKKEILSNSMRERLMREASGGLDPDKKQTNVILYICIGVALLVLAGR